MKILSKILWSNRSGKGISWFHPRACALGDSSRLFMTLQSIGGGDFYGALHESTSDDGGVTWSDPVSVPGYGWKTIGGDISEGVCDVVNEYHAPTKTILAIGHNVYYKNGRLFDSLCDWGTKNEPKLCRYPVWGIRTDEGKWSAVRRKLEIPGFEDCSIYSCGSSQRLFLDNDLLLIPFTFGEFSVRDRHVCTALFRYDGKDLHFLQRGNTLNFPVDRGFLEPSLIKWKDHFLLTLRAEDGKGYYAESTDGISWSNPVSWEFDDSTPFVTSTPQQHFLELAGHLFLIYTRADGRNAHVFRFRAPLYMAEVNSRMELIRNSEQIKLPKSIRAGQIEKLEFPYIFEVDGRKVSSKFSLGCFLVPKFTGDWNKVPVIKMTNKCSKKDFTAKDYSVSYQTAWTKDGLRLRVSVKDDMFSAGSAREYRWYHDIIQVYFDTRCSALRTGKKVCDEDDYEFGLMPTPDGKRCEVWRAFQPDMQLTLGTAIPNSNALAPEIATKFRRTADGYVYEANFPAPYLLPIQFKAGYAFGFGLYAADRDKTKRPDHGFSNTIMPGLSPYNHPERWPIAILVE